MIDRLRRLPGFDTLDDAALEVIVARATARRFDAGQLVFAGGSVADMLIACLDGRLETVGGAAMPPVFDAPGLLFGLAVPEDIVAGPGGLEAIMIAKPHAFTIAREFPAFIVSLMDAAEARR